MPNFSFKHCSKIVEKTLSNQIINVLESNSILTDCQFGFMKCGNTTSAINLLMELLYENFGQRRSTEGIFWALQKLFYANNHDILEKNCLSTVFYHVSHLSLKTTFKIENNMRLLTIINLNFLILITVQPTQMIKFGPLLF